MPTTPRPNTKAWLTYHTDPRSTSAAKLNIYALGQSLLLASATINTLYQPTHGISWEIDRLVTLGRIREACHVVEKVIAVHDKSLHCEDCSAPVDSGKRFCLDCLEDQDAIPSIVTSDIQIVDIEYLQSTPYKSNSSRLDDLSTATSRATRRQTYKEVGTETDGKLSTTTKPPVDRVKDHRVGNSSRFGFRKGKWVG